MAVTPHNKLLKTLKLKLRLVQRREEQGRKKLRSTLKKLQALGKEYKNKLSKNIRLMESKMSAAQASTYAKAAVDLERKLMKGIETKKRAFAKAVAKIEKKHALKMMKDTVKKIKKRQASKPK